MEKHELNPAEELFLQGLGSGTFSRYELRKVGIHGKLLTKLVKYGILVEELNSLNITVYRVNDGLVNGGT